MIAPCIEQSHIFDAESIDLSHPSVEDSVSLPPMFAAFPFDGFLLAVDGLLDSLFHAAVEDPDAFLLLCFFSIRLMETPAMNVGSPEQIAESRVGKIDTLLDFELRPFVWIVSIDQRFPALHAKLYPFEGELLAVPAHLFIVEVPVVVFVELLPGDRCVSLEYWFRPTLHIFLCL